MRRFYALTNSPASDELQWIESQELAGVDIRPLWQGTRVDEEKLSRVKFFMNDKLKADYLANPMGLPILSERAKNILVSGVRSDEVQVIPASIYQRHTNQKVEGYYLLNALRVFSALSPTCDPECAPFTDLEIVGNKIPTDAHLFRLIEYSPILIISEDLFHTLSGKDLKGMGVYPVITI